MLSSGLFVPGKFNIRAIGDLTKFSLVLLEMKGIPSKPVNSLGVEAGIPDPEIVVHHALLAIWFLSGLIPAYILFGASFRFRIIIGDGVGGVLHLLRNYLEVTLIESP